MKYISTNMKVKKYVHDTFFAAFVEMEPSYNIGKIFFGTREYSTYNS